MSFHEKKNLLALAAIAATATCATAIARAEMSQDQYLSALKIAEKKVLRTKAVHESSASGALSSSIVKALYGRYYQVGDHWDVAAWHSDSAQARMTSDPRHLETKSGRPGIFHYEVTEVHGGTQPQVAIEVTQLEQYGVKPVDAKVSKLVLTMNDQMEQSQKAYVLTDSPRLIHVSPEGIHSALTLLELFPLDVPEVVTAERREASALPALPERLQAIADTAGYHPDLSQSFWFEQDDFFGRAVQVLWQHGNPWPSYLKTANGVAVLISK